MNELYDTVNGLRPKLAFSLDDRIRKKVGTWFLYHFYIDRLNILPDLPQEMHEKLSQAVKLYDQLLTEQHSRPRWSAMQEGDFIPNAGVSSLLPHANVQPTIFLTA